MISSFVKGEFGVCPEPPRCSTLLPRHVERLEHGYGRKAAERLWHRYAGPRVGPVIKWPAPAHEGSHLATFAHTVIQTWMDHHLCEKLVEQKASRSAVNPPPLAPRPRSPLSPRTSPLPLIASAVFASLEKAVWYNSTAGRLHGLAQRPAANVCTALGMQDNACRRNPRSQYLAFERRRRLLSPVPEPGPTLRRAHGLLRGSQQRLIPQ